MLWIATLMILSVFDRIGGCSPYCYLLKIAIYLNCYCLPPIPNTGYPYLNYEGLQPKTNNG